MKKKTKEILTKNIPEINSNSVQIPNVINNNPPVITNIPANSNIPPVIQHPSVSIELPIPQNNIQNQIFDALNTGPSEIIPKPTSNLVSKINNIPIW